MLVDPNTGQVISYSQQAQAQTVLGSFGQSLVNDPTSPAHEFMAAIPGFATMGLFNMNRGVNTVMGGGFRTNRGSFLTRGNSYSSSFFNTFSPTRMGSFASPRALLADPDGPNYTPYNFLGPQGDKLLNWVGRRTSEGKMGYALLSNMGASPEDLAKMKGGESVKMLDGGTLARISVGKRLGDMGYRGSGDLSRSQRKRLAKTLYSMEEMGLNPGSTMGAPKEFFNQKTRRGRKAAYRKYGGLLNRRHAQEASSMMFGSLNGKFTGRIAAEVSGLLYGSFGGAGSSRAGQYLTKNVTRHLGGAAYMNLIQGGSRTSISYALQARKIGQKKLAGTLVARAGLQAGMKFLPYVGWAMLASDVTRMGIAGLKAGAELGKDAVKSMQGQINKPVMGMGYKDNAVNATSRARGLSAIQQSRLNSRNALGNEAGMLAGHFG